MGAVVGVCSRRKHALLERECYARDRLDWTKRVRSSGYALVEHGSAQELWHLCSPDFPKPFHCAAVLDHRRALEQRGAWRGVG
jgi:hypothetical protein